MQKKSVYCLWIHIDIQTHKPIGKITVSEEGRGKKREEWKKITGGVSMYFFKKKIAANIAK